AQLVRDEIGDDDAEAGHGGSLAVQRLRSSVPYTEITAPENTHGPTFPRPRSYPPVAVPARPGLYAGAARRRRAVRPRPAARRPRNDGLLPDPLRRHARTPGRDRPQPQRDGDQLAAVAHAPGRPQRAAHGDLRAAVRPVRPAGRGGARRGHRTRPALRV